MELHEGSEEFTQRIKQMREEFLKLADHFVALAEVGINSEGSATLEWPTGCPRWRQQKVMSMIVKFDMTLTFPTGCGFRLKLEGKKPLKPRRMVTTHARLAPAGHVHDRLEEAFVQLGL